MVIGVPKLEFGNEINIFDISDDLKNKAKHLKTIPIAVSAHHIVFSPEGCFAIVQNSFLNLPDMSDGSITVIDLLKHRVRWANFE